MNTVNLVGRLTRDPELFYTKDGISLCKFTLAVQRSFRNNNGTFDADFIPCVAWRRQAETTAEYCHKGALVSVNGRVVTSSFETRDGQRATQTQIVAERVRFLITNKAETETPAAETEGAEHEVIGAPPPEMVREEPVYSSGASSNSSVSSSSSISEPSGSSTSGS
ncbi:single stranded DNA-binding protein [Salsuginibacillus halophilus]|uniref:Single-stranded DNA-binding protein n=1 Tax=Salsuginibacillus halophilus TaxID=517424 RepID=A0A2P8HQQ5_9BACI|nr:single-stranded DNA-binding protein [Salsuginibacillus halophilus]PSL48553.1 single stranded DNA-binding protein [Salsuginibacillus halophilus]